VRQVPDKINRDWVRVAEDCLVPYPGADTGGQEFCAAEGL
jgi:hypothetical protein